MVFALAFKLGGGVVASMLKSGIVLSLKAMLTFAILEALGFFYTDMRVCVYICMYMHIHIQICKKVRGVNTFEAVMG